MHQDPLDYPHLLQQALRGLVRRCLEIVAGQGLPPGHHFYLTFDSQAPGVELGADLRESYPETMTIILQHQFWDLEVDDEGFSVSLSFSGRSRNLRVPFAALISFVDPEAQFGLQLSDASAEAPEVEEVAPHDDGADGSAGSDRGSERASAKVVSIDAFRKR